MRWGQRDESTDDHQTMTICLEEVGVERTFTPGSFFVRFQKTQGQLQKNSRPILGKKLNLSEAYSDFTKKLKKFKIQITVFHGGHIF